MDPIHLATFLCIVALYRSTIIFVSHNTRIWGVGTITFFKRNTSNKNNISEIFRQNLKILSKILKLTNNTFFLLKKLKTAYLVLFRYLLKHIISKLFVSSKRNRKNLDISSVDKTTLKFHLHFF